MQTVRVVGACLAGTLAELVTVEARFERAERERTEVVLTGLPDPLLRESRGKLVSALSANGLRILNGRLYLNLVPASRRKSGDALELALVLAAAAACGHLEGEKLRSVLFLGEVGIDGELHSVPGGLASALAASELGIRTVIAPPAMAAEAACVPGVSAHGATHLSSALAHLTGKECLAAQPCSDELPPASACESLDDVRGQAAAKHALTVAAAGGHGLLLIGPPGAGKSMLARRMLSLLCPPSFAERLEITSVLSAIGRWPGGLARERPFRAPHHTASYAGLVGGGAPPRPGEITLAHGGLLFLDELPEFSRSALEALRQPMESGVITLSRAGARLDLPARFQFLGAMNPCPCGQRGNPLATCHCSPGRIASYCQRISGPLLDRIDLRIELLPTSLDELAPHASPAEPAACSHLSAETLRARIESAARHRRERQGELANARLSAADLDRCAALTQAERRFLRQAIAQRRLSTRAVQSLRRVARTLADLEGRSSIDSNHLASALALRAPLFEEEGTAIHRLRAP